MDFASSEEGKGFWSSGAARRAADAVLYAIALSSRDTTQAESIWLNGVIPGCTVRRSEDVLYETAMRNFPVPAQELIWHDDASWAVRASARLLANSPAARWPHGPIVRKSVFEGWGIRIVRENGIPVLERRSDGRLYRNYLSEEQASLAMRSGQAAAAVLEEVKVCSDLSLDGKAAVRLVHAHLAEPDPTAWSHAIVRAREHDGRCAIAVQSIDAEGAIGHRLLSFDVDPAIETIVRRLESDT